MDKSLTTTTGARDKASRLIIERVSNGYIVTEHNWSAGPSMPLAVFETMAGLVVWLAANMVNPDYVPEASNG